MSEKFNVDAAEPSTVELTLDGEKIVISPFEFEMAFEREHSDRPTMTADVEAVRKVLGKPDLDERKAGAVLEFVREYIADCRDGKHRLFRRPA
jgi:3-hydroxy-3-methylglutaryl CoA synthase